MADNNNADITRSQGIKKSNFPAQTTIPDTATLDFVFNNTNIKITKANFLVALGVTGTIVQAGDPTGTAILDVAGTVNRIRTVEDGPGILSSVSPLNGLKLEHNFATDTTGIEIPNDLALAQPTWASLLPGAGMAITKVNDVITLTATGVALPSTLTVTINQFSDFPAPVSGVVTLVAGIIYIISNDVSTTNRFVLSENTSVIGHSLRGATLTYTGTGTMFTGVDVSALFLNLHLNCATGKVFDFSDTVGGIKSLGINSVQVESCDTIGDFNDMRSVAFNISLFFSIATNGVVFSGSNYVATLIEIVNFASTSATFVAVDFGTSVSESIMVDSCVFEGVSGAIAVKGAASNANLTATGQGEVTGSAYIGAITPVSVISLTQDVQWIGSNNQGLQDTRPDSLSYNTAGTTVTIGTIGVPVKIGGTWIDDNSAHFTVDLAGRVTYNGKKTIQVPVSASVTADPVSGGAKDFKVSIAKGGTPVTPSAIPARAASGDLIAITNVWQITFNENEFIELFLQNDTDTTNFDVTHAILRID